MLDYFTLEASGRNVAYFKGGRGPLIVMIASTGRSGIDFVELAELMIKRGYTVFLPDPRGVGGSNGLLHGISFYELASDVAEVIKNHGDRAFVVGHAYGAWIARTLAQAYPDYVRGIVLLAAAAGKWPKHLSGAINLLCDKKASRNERLTALRLAFFAENSDPYEWLSGWHQHVVDAQRNARENTHPSWQESGTAPILDLLALQDPFRPPESYDSYRKQFGDRVTVKMIDGASHALPHERPFEVAQELDNWAAQFPS